MTNQKGISPIVIILIVVGILIVAGGVYYFVFQKLTQTEQQLSPSEEIADWKTFTDSQIGYSFKYPQDWEATTRTGGHYISKSINGKIYGTVLTQYATWENFERTNGKISFEDYVNGIKNEHLADENVKNFKEEKILLGGKEAVKFSYEVPDRTLPVIPGVGVSEGGIKLGEFDSEIYIKTDKGIFYLVGSAVREKETYYPIVNQILSVFTF